MPKISELVASTALTDDDLLLLVDGGTSTKKITALDAADYFGAAAAELGVALSDESTAISAGTAKLTVRAPYDMTLSEVRASLNTASSSGAVTVDINVDGATILSTKLTIDQGEKTSTSAATSAVINDTFVADDAEITFDVDGAGSGAKGLKVFLLGTRGGVDRTVHVDPGAAAATGTANNATATVSNQITFIASTNTTYASRTNTTVTKPTGTADGDLVLLGVFTGEASGDPADPTPPGGFTLLTGYPMTATAGGFSVETRVYSKIASSEGASWDFTHSAHSTQGFAVTYRGVNSGSPFDVTSSTNTGTSGTTTATSVTTAHDGAMVIYLAHDWGNAATSLVPPTGTTPTFTERIDVLLMYLADGLMATAGATGSKTQTNRNGGTDAWAASLIALRPA